jgi:hypothetical protein
MNLFDERRLPPEIILLTFGAVEVQKFSWQFRQWKGVPPEVTHGPKPIVECGDKPVFAELAIIPILTQHGFKGAIWRDNWRKCFRDSMPAAKRVVPEPVREVYGSIVAANGGHGGCWDVIAWNSEGTSFIELKWRTDIIRSTQKKWLESGLHVGLRLKNFAICEWEFVA